MEVLALIIIPSIYLLGLLQDAPKSGGDLVTPERIFWSLALLASLAGHIVQLRNSRSGVIHETDMKQINSLDGALKRTEVDRDIAQAKSKTLEAELSSVKSELVTLMAIDIHEVLGYAALRRKAAALEAECEHLNTELAQERRK